MKNKYLWICTAFALLTFGALTAQAEQRVYLLVKLGVENTTFGLAAFMYDPDATTIAACEDDIMRGNRGQWQYYGHAVRKFKGVSTTLSYACVTTDLAISDWQAHDRYSYIYLIDRRGPSLKVTRYDNYATCLTKLHQTQEEESNTFFCAKSNQEIEPA